MCPLCQNTDLPYLFSSRDYISLECFAVYTCPKCDLAITEIKPENEDLAQYYKDGYYGKRKSFTDNIINDARIKKLTALISVSKPSLLDIGCGNGGFFLGLRTRGWSSFGTEIAPAEHLKDDADRFIYRGDFIHNVYVDEQFDAITMWHSLEHVVNPLQYFIESKRILKKDGIVLVEVPNFQSLQATIFKANWFHLDVPRHTLHFSPKSVAILFKKSGLGDSTIRAGSSMYGFFGCLQSMLNVVSRRKNLLFDFLNTKITLGEIYKNNKRDLFVTIVVCVPIVVLACALFTVESVTNRSGVIVAYARKEV